MTFSDALVVAIVWVVAYILLGPILATLITVVSVIIGLKLKSMPIEEAE